MIKKGEVVAVRGYGSGVTVGTLATDYKGEEVVALSEAYHLIEFIVSKKTNGGAMFDLTCPVAKGQKLEGGKICGGSPAIVTRPDVFSLVPDPAIWAAIKEHANKY